MPGSAESRLAGSLSDGTAVHLQVQFLNGHEFRLSVAPETSGRELQELVSAKLDFRKGRKLVLHHRASELLPDLALQHQGIDSSQEAILSCTFLPTDLYTAWRYVQGLASPEFPMEGVTRLEGAPPGPHIFSLPKWLESLAFHHDFNESLVGVNLPTGLQSLTFGKRLTKV
eukprot:s8_g21.t1